MNGIRRLSLSVSRHDSKKKGQLVSAAAATPEEDINKNSKKVNFDADAMNNQHYYDSSDDDFDLLDEKDGTKSGNGKKQMWSVRAFDEVGNSSADEEDDKPSIFKKKISPGSPTKKKKNKASSSSNKSDGDDSANSSDKTLNTTESEKSKSSSPDGKKKKESFLGSFLDESAAARPNGANACSSGAKSLCDFFDKDSNSKKIIPGSVRSTLEDALQSPRKGSLPSPSPVRSRPSIQPPRTRRASSPAPGMQRPPASPGPGKQRAASDVVTETTRWQSGLETDSSHSMSSRKSNLPLDTGSFNSKSSKSSKNSKTKKKRSSSLGAGKETIPEASLDSFLDAKIAKQKKKDSGASVGSRKSKRGDGAASVVSRKGKKKGGLVGQMEKIDLQKKLQKSESVPNSLNKGSSRSVRSKVKTKVERRAPKKAVKIDGNEPEELMSPKKAKRRRSLGAMNDKKAAMRSKTRNNSDGNLKDKVKAMRKDLAWSDAKVELFDADDDDDDSSEVAPKKLEKSSPKVESKKATDNDAPSDAERGTQNAKWDVLRNDGTAITPIQKAPTFSTVFDGPAGSPLSGRKAMVPVNEALVDERLAGIEKFEKALAKEREALNQEKKSISFQKESLELQLQEEAEKNDALNRKLRVVERQLQSEKMSNVGASEQDVTNLLIEVEQLKLKLKRERRETEQTIYQKETEISELKKLMGEMAIAQNMDDGGDDTSAGDKSRGRLQGELMHSTVKLKERESRISDLQGEVRALKEELKAHHDMRGVTTSPEGTVHENGRKQCRELADKVKEKDETIVFLMAQLKKLKQSRGDMDTSGHGNGNSTWFGSLDISVHSRRRGSMRQGGVGGLDSGTYHGNGSVPLQQEPKSPMAGILHKFSPGTLRNRVRVRSGPGLASIAAPQL